MERWIHAIFFNPSVAKHSKLKNPQSTAGGVRGKIN
jgi:hypothetical protein